MGSDLLAGHRAVVTGGGSGIGAATTRRFAAEGAAVAVLDVDGDAAAGVAREIGGLDYAVDVRDLDAVTAAIDDAATRLDGLSVLFNNAGVGSLSKLHEYPAEEWDRVVGTNLTGAWHVLRAAAPHLLSGGDGRIVNTASISGVRPAAGEGPYAATKAAIVALTASAALEYAPTVRVNAVSPGTIRSALTSPLLAIPDEERRHVDKTPMGRIGEPGDVADVVVFLCSDLARFVTGQNVVVDGGLTLHTSGVDGVLDLILGLMEGG